MFNLPPPEPVDPDMDTKLEPFKLVAAYALVYALNERDNTVISLDATAMYLNTIGVHVPTNDQEAMREAAAIYRKEILSTIRKRELQFITSVFDMVQAAPLQKTKIWFPQAMCAETVQILYDVLQHITTPGDKHYTLSSAINALESIKVSTDVPVMDAGIDADREFVDPRLVEGIVNFVGWLCMNQIRPDNLGLSYVQEKSDETSLMPVLRLAVMLAVKLHILINYKCYFSTYDRIQQRDYYALDDRSLCRMLFAVFGGRDMDARMRENRMIPSDSVILADEPPSNGRCQYPIDTLVGDPMSTIIMQARKALSRK